MKFLILGPGADSISEEFSKQGHTRVYSLDASPHVAVYINYAPSRFMDMVRAGRRKIPLVLLASEPSVIIPWNTKEKVLRRFDFVISVGRNLSHVQVPCAQLAGFQKKYFENECRLSSVVAINANKHSFVSGELYSFRRQCFSKINGVQLYGPFWSQRWIESAVSVLKSLIWALSSLSKLSRPAFQSLFTNPPKSHGIVEDKLAILSRYKCTLVIENSQEYVSEKVLDALLAGTIPVYIGGDLDLLNIPDGLVIPAKPTLDSVRRSIESAQRIDYPAWKIRAKSWLIENEYLKNYKPEVIEKEIVRLITDFLRRKF